MSIIDMSLFGDKVDASYGGSLLWQNGIFPLGALYSNAYGD
jgi:hypothetical protein